MNITYKTSKIPEIHQATSNEVLLNEVLLSIHLNIGKHLQPDKKQQKQHLSNIPCKLIKSRV